MMKQITTCIFIFAALLCAGKALKALPYSRIYQTQAEYEQAWKEFAGIDTFRGRQLDGLPRRFVFFDEGRRGTQSLIADQDTFRAAPYRPGPEYEAYYSKNLNGFAGVWRYASGRDTLTVKLSPAIYNNRERKLAYECLAGGYRYVKNGVLVTDCLDSLRTDISALCLVPVMARNAIPNADNVRYHSMHIYFHDLGLEKCTVAGSLRLMMGKTDEARWYLEDDEEGEIEEGDEVEPNGFSVPTNVVMKKIKSYP